MNLRKVFLAALSGILSFTICLAQNAPETVEGENWVSQSGLYPTPVITFRYDRYSREDAAKFREKFDLLKAAESADEWEGSYYTGFSDEVGVSSFQWNTKTGFINFYVYSCLPELRYLSYGKIVNTPEFIQTIPEFSADSPRREEPVKYVKVKWDKRRYLVEESSLQAFAERVVGIYVEPEDDAPENRQKWANHVVKGDMEKEPAGLPEFPASYKKFQRQPIETTITLVGKRTIEVEKQFGDSTYTKYFLNSAIYPVTIGAGKKSGIKAGMRFEIFETGEEIYITEVKQNTAAGFIARSTDENKNDECYADEYNTNQTACTKIKTALRVRTIAGKIWF